MRRRRRPSQRAKIAERRDTPIIEAERQTKSSAILAAQARAAAGSTAFAAALLLYFGYTSLEPSRKDLGDWSLWILFYTLRIGGIACMVLTIVLFLGVGAALVVDAIVSVVIGALLILTGAGLAFDGGYLPQAAINVVCGFLFTSSGLHTARQFIATRARFSSDDLRPDNESVDPEPRALGPLPAHSMRARTSELSPNVVARTRPQDSTTAQGPTPKEIPTRVVKVEESAPPEGFLASLAKERQRKDDASGAA